jgi:predicted RNA-binding Zn ribbon-like protein
MSRLDRFEFIAGSPSLCLVDTLGNRGGGGFERLKEPKDLQSWLRAAKLAAVEAITVTQRSLTAAQRLREAIYRCGLAVVMGQPMARADIDTINRCAARTPLRPQLINLALVQIGTDPVQAALSTLAADALNVLGSHLRHRIRICADCQMMFLDTSRPGRRRWCSSVSGCGNRAKVRALRARRREFAPGAPGNG